MLKGSIFTKYKYWITILSFSWTVFLNMQDTGLLILKSEGEGLAFKM